MSTTENRAKRISSPESISSENPEDKRLKVNGHIPQVIIDLPQEEKELTFADIKRFMDTILARVDKNGLALQNLTSKQDYIELNDQVTAQGMESNN